MRPGTLLRWNGLKEIFKKEIRYNMVIFDIGGFDGYIARNIKKEFPDHNLKITVVDNDKSGLMLAKKQGLTTLCASAVELPIKDNQADIVLCLDLLEHVHEDYKVINEISRILKKNGKVILTTPMENGVSFPFLTNKKNALINKEWGHIRKGYSIKKIEELFQINNLVILKKSKYFNFFTRFVYWLNAFSKIPLRDKSILFRLIIKFEPYIKYGAQEHILVAKKVKL